MRQVNSGKTTVDGITTVFHGLKRPPCLVIVNNFATTGDFTDSTFKIRGQGKVQWVAISE